MATVTLRMTGYSDTPLIVTLLAAPKGVTVSEEVCIVILFLLLAELSRIEMSFLFRCCKFRMKKKRRRHESSFIGAAMPRPETAMASTPGMAFSDVVVRFTAVT